jgi:hypothetical protein
MIAARSVHALNPGRPPQTKSLIWSIVRDFIAVATLGLVSLAAGLATNRLYRAPLPLIYQPPEQRFDAELATLVTSPPFEIPPAATVGLSLLGGIPC